MKFLARLAMKGWLQTFMLTAIFAWLSIRFVPVVILATGFVAMYTLRKGAYNGALLAAVIAVLVWMLSFYVETRPGLEIPMLLVLLAPVLIGSHVLLKTEAQGYSVMTVCLCGLLQALIIQFYSGDAVAWWGEWIKLAVSGVEGATYEGFEDDGTLELFNGLMAMGLAILTFLSILLGRYLQASQVNPGGCMTEFCALQVPSYALTLTVVSAGLAYFISINLMYDVLIIALVMYFFQGLAVLHATVVNRGMRSINLFPAYFLVLIAPQYGLVGFALVGIMDIFLNFRKLPVTLTK